jgi:hypothetical protein
LSVEDADPQFDRVSEAVITFMQQAGFDPRYGRRVVADLAAAGLADVRGEGRARVIDSSSPGFDFFRLSFESLRDARNKRCRRRPALIRRRRRGRRPLRREPAPNDADDDGRDRAPLSTELPLTLQPVCGIL